MKPISPWKSTINSYWAKSSENDLWVLSSRNFNIWNSLKRNFDQTGEGQSSPKKKWFSQIDGWIAGVSKEVNNKLLRNSTTDHWLPYKTERRFRLQREKWWFSIICCWNWCDENILIEGQCQWNVDTWGHCSEAKIKEKAAQMLL